MFVVAENGHDILRFAISSLTVFAKSVPAIRVCIVVYVPHVENSKKSDSPASILIGKKEKDINISSYVVRSRSVVVIFDVVESSCRLREKAPLFALFAVLFASAPGSIHIHNPVSNHS